MVRIKVKPEQRKDRKTGELKMKNVPLLMDCTFDGKRMWIQTGMLIDRKNWDSKNHRIKSSVMNSIELNAVLQKKVSDVERVFTQAELNDVILTVGYIRNILNQVKKSSNKSFVEYYDEYIHNESLKCADNTIKKHKTALSILQKFALLKRISLDFEIIDTEFFHKYVEYLGSKLNHSNVTISKYVKCLKQFLNYCTQKGYNKNVVYKTFSFSSKDPEIIALKRDEITAIKNLDLSSDQNLDAIKDCFLFLCYTSLRYSDAANLRLENFVNGTLEYTSIKTKSAISIPLHPFALEIINKYKNSNTSKLLPFISNQKMNFYLKDIGKLAKLDRDVVKVKYYGAERREFPKKLYEVLTTHLGRKSFISYLFNQGMDSELIRSYSGHKSASSFARYNKIEPSFQKAQLLEKFDI